MNKKKNKHITSLWNSNSGPIRICDMGDKHLQNTIHMIRRIAIEGENIGGCYGHTADEMDYWTEPYDGPEDVSPLYPDLIREAKRRNLNM